MIEWGDVYKVVVAMMPLYVALALGYGSVKWWGMFKPDQCDAINRFNCYFIYPFFTFQFTARVNPYSMNYRFLAGDVVAKAIAAVALALWANLWRNGNFSWAITSFNLSCFNNTLVVGVPLLRAMYGVLGEDLVVQSSVIQALLWVPTLLFLLQLRRTMEASSDQEINPNAVAIDCPAADGQLMKQLSSIEIVPSSASPKHEQHQQQEDLNKVTDPNTINNVAAAAAITTTRSSVLSPSLSFGSIMKVVWAKVAKNPNSYACALGLIWALISERWHFEMPSIVDGSIQIMGKAGSGVAMFTMGLFMALQEKVLACGVRLTMYSMVMRFVAGPLTTAVGSLALGLRGNVLRIAIIQAALPQAIVSFVFAQEYDLHANVLGTAIIFGTTVSLPLLIAYYVGLDALH